MEHLRFMAGVAVILSALALVELLFSKDRTGKKLTMIIGLIITSIAGYRIINKVLGTPRVLDVDLKDAQLAGVRPNPEKGVIYLWVIGKDGVPTSYQIPFKSDMSKALQKRMEQAGGNGTVEMDVKAQQKPGLGDPLEEDYDYNMNLSFPDQQPLRKDGDQ